MSFAIPIFIRKIFAINSTEGDEQNYRLIWERRRKLPMLLN
jgi:hypothetical protein